VTPTFKMAALALACALPLAPAFAADPAPATQSAGLSRLLAAELARFPSKSGFYVKNLATGEEASVDPDGHYDSASTIKVAVMILAYRLADQKKLNLDERHEIGADDLRGGSGILRFHDLGLKPTLRDLITQMTITSDNVATDIMIARVGGVGAVNDFLKREGYAAIRLNKTVLDYYRSVLALVDPKYGSLSVQDSFALDGYAPVFAPTREPLLSEYRKAAAARGPTRLPRGEAHWIGVMSPREAGRMMESIERGTAASAAACAEMKRILLAQQLGARKMPHFLTAPTGRKTGGTTGVTNDFGIVYAKSGPIVIASFNMDVTGLAADADDRIGAVSRIAVEYFGGGS